MTKAQKEKAERLMLKQMIDTNPKLKAFLDANIDNDDVTMAEAIKPVIETKLKESFNKGVLTGFSGAYLGMYEKAKTKDTLQEVLNMLRAEADSVRAKLGLSDVDTLEEEIKANAEE